MKLQYLNYKEPLIAVGGGFGYMGTLAQTEDRTEVQCHICGKLFENLGVHAWTSHQMKARDYRIRFNLGLRTPLCSDTFSDRYREMKSREWANKSDEEKRLQKELMASARKKTKRIGNPTSLEIQNKRGVCPDQLIERVLECAEALGKSPTYKDFEEFFKGKYVGSIIRTFGSWNGVKNMAGLPSNKSGANIPHNRNKYTDEELLEFLRSAYKEKGKIPTFSDFKRGYLPSYYLYQHRFGGISKARELAGIQ